MVASSPVRKILAVDDSRQNLFVLEKLLERLDGVRVICTTSGDEALRLALEHDFSLGIIDVQMPAMDGYELVELLRGNRATAELPVIFVSAIYSDEYHHRKGYEVGAVDFLSKPFVPDILLSKVKVFLQLYDQRLKLEALYHAERQRRTLAESLEQIGRVLASSLDLRALPERILEELAAVVPYDRGAVLLEEEGALRIIAEHGFPADTPALGALIPIRPGDVFAHMLATHAPVILDDVTETSAWQQVEWLPINKSWLGMPLLSKDKLIGMISLTRIAAHAFTRADATLAAAFASQAAIALENASLYASITRFNEELEHLVRVRTEALNDAYQILEKLDKTKSDFINVAAHELRTPLTLIKGYTQLLVQMAADLPEAQPVLQGILSGQERLYEVVNSMLDISKIDSQALSVHKEHVHLLTIITGVRTSFESALTQRHLTLTIADLTHLPHVYADPDLMAKLFYHLLANAVKYTPDGGQITIDGTLKSTPDEGNWVQVSIHDTGIGIDPAYHEMIFEKFFQTGEVRLHSSGKTKFKGGGPGLGLAIVRGIVLAHGGRVWVESPGEDERALPGSTFHVALLMADHK